MVFAARKAVGRDAEIGIRPETSPRIPGAAASKAPATPPADQLYFAIHDAAHLAALESALDRVAASHGLLRKNLSEAAPTPGLLRFEYCSGNRCTHAIHIFLSTVRGRHAIPARAASGPRLAIVIDDLGYDRAAAEALFALPYRFTVSVLPHHPVSADLAEEAHLLGYEVMLHLPMESANGDARPEAIELRVGMNPEEVARSLSQMLETVPYAVGVNNHQGSRATTNAALMAALMPALREREMFLIDSRTTSGSVAYAVARRAGIPSAYRSVFLDDTQTREATLQQLAHAERLAREQGWVIAIGHPHPTTLEALVAYLPGAESRGIRLVFASELVR